MRLPTNTTRPVQQHDADPRRNLRLIDMDALEAASFDAVDHAPAEQASDAQHVHRAGQLIPAGVPMIDGSTELCAAPPSTASSLQISGRGRLGLWPFGSSPDLAARR
jgi:hypothetical protein